MTKIYIGKITSTHGIKGELKIKSEFEKTNKVFKINNYLYIDDEQHEISSYRVHKNFHLVTIDKISDINDVYKYVGKDVYFEREDLKLEDNEYLLEDLIDMEVYDEDDLIGKVRDIYQNNVQNILKLDKILIPLVPHFVKRIDLESKRIYTVNVGELHDED